MANSQSVVVREDGPVNVVVDVIGVLTASDQAYGVVVNPATLGFTDPDNTYKAKELRVLRVIGNCSDGLEISLFFDASAPLLFETFNGRLDVNYRPRFGAKQNNATSPTGSIGLSTTGFSTGTPANYTLTLELLKIWK